MRRLLIISIYLITYNLSGQDFIGSEKRSIKWKIKEQYGDKGYTVKFIETALKIDTIMRFDIPDAELYKKLKLYGANFKDSMKNVPITIDKIDTTFKLSVVVTKEEKIELEYFFDGYPYQLCDSIFISYDCLKCAKRDVKSILSNKNRQWKKIDNSRYISRSLTKSNNMANKPETVGSPQMTIKYSKPKSTPSTIILNVPMYDRKTWEKLTK